MLFSWLYVSQFAAVIIGCAGMVYNLTQVSNLPMMRRCVGGTRELPSMITFPAFHAKYALCS